MINDDRGEATVVLSVLGALASGAPILLALSGRAFGDGLIWWGAIAAALVAIGVAVGKVWGLARAAVRKLDRIEALIERADRMEIAQLALQEQVRDLTEHVRPTP